jgi:putative phosphoribosyl transferase
MNGHHQHTRAPFRDRYHAGQELAKDLIELRGSNALVLALPRGGVLVGYEIAQALEAPMNAFIVRKIGVPDQPELAMGAVASGGVRVLNQQLISALGISQEEVDRITRIEEERVEEQERLYHGDREFDSVEDRTAILVDDGIATGSTMKAAITAVRLQNPFEVIIAVPVGSPEVCKSLRKEVDRVLCLISPYPFYAVGQFYEDFSEVSDDEVRSLIEETQLH